MERQGGERARERRENVPERRTWSQRRGNRFQIAIAKLLQIKNWFSSMYPLLVLVARKIIKSTNLAGPSSYSNPLKPELNYSNCGVQIKKKNQGRPPQSKNNVNLYFSGSNSLWNVPVFKQHNKGLRNSKMKVKVIIPR